MAAGNSSTLNGHDNWAAPRDVEPVPSRQPRTTAQLFIHSQDTLRALTGRPMSESKCAIIGLFGFAECLSEVWDAAKRSDPYAWWWLTKTEDAHATAQSKIRLELEILRKALDADPELDVQVAASDFPTCIDLNFACPYAYWGARVLKSFDELILAATTTESLGLRLRAAHMEKRLRCKRSIRALFASAQGFRSIGISVDDINNVTNKAAQAHELMGPLPATVLSGERFPTLLPNETRPMLSTSEQ